jgi:hypothetical protein
MKFWVKAVGTGGGEDLQEQLLVTADSCEDLHRQLEALLNVSILQISVTDFASQVVDRISSGADIITVRIIRGSSSGLGAASATGLSRKDSGGFQRRDSGLSAASVAAAAAAVGGGGAAPSSGALEYGRRGSSPVGVDPFELTAGSSLTDIAHAMPQWSAGSGADGSKKGSGAAPQTPVNERSSFVVGGSSAKRGGGPNTAGESSSGIFSDIPSIDKICLKRADLGMLLGIRFQAAFHDAITGCFVRVKDTQGPGYSVVQVVGVHGELQVVVDMIHFVEMRQLDSISNSSPSHDEVKAWGRKMIAASRSLVTDGFVEAKLSDLKSSLRTAQVAANPSPPPTGGGSSRALSVSGQDSDGGALNPVGAGSQSPSPETQVSRLRRKQTIAPHNNHDPFRQLVGKNLVRTNDAWSGSMLVTEDSDVVFFGTRQSNCRSKHQRPSDFSGAMMTFNGSGDFAVEADRDATIKGYCVAGTPQMWRGMYVLLALPAPAQTLGGEGISPHASSGSGNAVGPVDLAESFSCDVTLLSGRDISALMNPPLKCMLPVPRWSAGGPLQAPPQIIAFRDEVHAFYLMPMLPSPVAGHRRLTVSGAVIGVAHAVSSDPKLQQWSVVSQDAPIVISAVSDMPLFHVSRSVPRVPATLTLSPDRGADRESLTLLWCDDANTSSHLTPPRRRLSAGNTPTLPTPPPSVNPTSDHVATVSKYVNSDGQTRAASWSPVPIVCSIGTEEWRAHGTRSIALFTPPPAHLHHSHHHSPSAGADATVSQYVVVAAEDGHRHTVITLFPLIE